MSSSSWALPGAAGDAIVPSHGRRVNTSASPCLDGAAPESNRPSRGLHDLTSFEDPLGHRAHAAPARLVHDCSAVRRAAQAGGRFIRPKARSDHSLRWPAEGSRETGFPRAHRAHAAPPRRLALARTATARGTLNPDVPGRDRRSRSDRHGCRGRRGRLVVRAPRPDRARGRRRGGHELPHRDRASPAAPRPSPRASTSTRRTGSRGRMRSPARPTAIRSARRSP